MQLLCAQVLCEKFGLPLAAFLAIPTVLKGSFEGSGTKLLAIKPTFKLKHSKNHMVAYGTMANQSLITLIFWSRALLLM